MVSVAFVSTFASNAPKTLTVLSPVTSFVPESAFSVKPASLTFGPKPTLL